MRTANFATVALAAILTAACVAANNRENRMAFGPTSNLNDFTVLFGEWSNTIGVDPLEIICTDPNGNVAPEGVLIANMSAIENGSRFARYNKGTVAGEIGQGLFLFSGTDTSSPGFALTFQTDGVRLRRWDGTAFTSDSFAFISIATVVGDLCECRINGTTLRVYLNGSAIGAYTHAGIAGITRFGLRCPHDSAPQRYANFEAGSL